MLFGQMMRSELVMIIHSVYRGMKSLITTDQNFIYFFCGPPIVGSHLFDHLLKSVFLFQQCFFILQSCDGCLSLHSGHSWHPFTSTPWELSLSGHFLPLQSGISSLQHALQCWCPFTQDILTFYCWVAMKRFDPVIPRWWCSSDDSTWKVLAL